MEISKIAIGSMRFPDQAAAAAILERAVALGMNYIDTAPLYRNSSETENAESWIGTALAGTDLRSRLLVSTKSTTSDGRMELGEFIPEKGFGVRTAEQFTRVFEQSLRRMGVDAVDYYHLWICHTPEQLAEAFKPGGWYEGYLRQKELGRVRQLGITTHADAPTIIRFLETGRFEAVTLPLSVINRTRLPAVEYAVRNGIEVLAMNPLGGGLLGADPNLRALAFRYLLALENVRILVGFTKPEEVEYARRALEEFVPVKPEGVVAAMGELIDTTDPRCTGCGYCQPCGARIDIGAALGLYNLYRYLHWESAREQFNRLQWNIRYNLKNCSGCGLCERRCPNGLPVRDLIRDAARQLYNPPSA